MTEYWARVDISRTQALRVLNELANPRSKLRRDLERSKASAQKALAGIGIEVSTSSLPARIRLPAPEKVADLRAHAQSLVRKDRRPFGWFILAVVFSAMPLVDAPQGDGAG